ncbi:MAG: ABC transporter permease [Proteobacteria bacterium]|nr:MAG: ABC transporter permease [Pseudomonadota bacterium]
MIAKPVKRVDPVALLFFILSFISVFSFAFINVKPNRIAAGEGKFISDLLDQPIIYLLILSFVVWAFVNMFASHSKLVRFFSANTVLFCLILAVGLTATHFAIKPAVRVTPSTCFWVVFSVFCLSITDALVRFKLRPWQRIAYLLGYLLAGFAVLSSGLLDKLAVMQEFHARTEQFWIEGLRHLQLSLGSLLIALLLGLPLGIGCFQVPRMRNIVLQTLSLVQTIPSLALFGLLMAPLAWLAAHSDWAQAMGIRGIGVAPALIALIMYSLLPIVANTVVGLENVSPAVREAAKGMGLTQLQRLFQVELPLALPVILTGIRIVLVQTMGLVTVAALVGGGGFGTFVFQGLGQTSTDLILLGALPTVFLAFVAAIVLDALVASLNKAWENSS